MIKKTIFIYMHNKPQANEESCIHIQKLDTLANGSVDEIVCNCMDSIPFINRQQILSALINKTKLDGIIILHTIDIRALAKYIINNKISLDQANTIIGGSASLIDDNTSLDLLNSIHNIKILDILYDNIQRVTTIQKIAK